MDKALARVHTALERVIRGKHDKLELLLIVIISGGHVLLEDLPGVGKTTLAKALAKTLNLKFTRVQFTPDLLPSDVLGMSVLNPRDGSFTFHEGPVFTNVLLADEINRASPRTQSALLEAMSERQVSIDNVTRVLDEPFFVLATQNPVEYQGTYPLPEAQLDRFMIRLRLGYPPLEEELRMVMDRRDHDPLDDVRQVMTGDELLAVQQAVRQVEVNRDVARYMIRLVEATRVHPEAQVGGSPRASLALFRVCQALAFIKGRSYVTPSDVQSALLPVLEHRLILNSQATYGGRTVSSLLDEILEREDVPV